MTTAAADPGSFRDPRGRVHHRDGRVFRTLSSAAAEDFDRVQATGLLDDLVRRGDLVSSRQANAADVGEAATGASRVLEHERIPFVSYPYEWGFAMLRAAALLHLRVQRLALERGVALSDATAYNVQFVGPRPVFIDVLSFRPYREGELWAGHRQFCEQFLNPLLLRALLGVAPNAWLRGSLEGISATEIVRLIPRRRWLSRDVLAHVVLPARFQRDSGGEDGTRVAEAIAEAALPRAAFDRMLAGLERWIGGLAPADGGATTWSDYERSRGYAPNEVERKRRFVREWAAEAKPGLVCDVGCNVGEFSEAALEGGAGYAVGLDLDLGALDAAFARATERGLRFLPIFGDVANPTPSQGFAERERAGLGARLPADGVLALGLVHHLAIGRNVPLDLVLDWLVDAAPAGVVEFVPKADPMVGRLLRLREDVFPGYVETAFVAALERRARIERAETITASGRRLFAFRRL